MTNSKNSLNIRKEYLKEKALIVAVFLSLLPHGEVYGFNKVKTANDYLDEAELIIEKNYMPLLEKKKGEKDKFLQLVNQSLKLEESARAYLYLGFVRHMAFDSDSYKDSVQYYKKAIELKPKYIRALVALSSAHTNGKNYQECMNSTNQVLKIDPQNKIAKRLEEDCQSSLDQHNLNECMKDYEVLWHREPKNKVVLKKIDECMVELGQKS